MAQNAPKTTPRVANNGPRDGSERLQGAPRRVQSTLWELQNSPRGPEGRPGGTQDGPGGLPGVTQQDQILPVPTGNARLHNI
eukprot:3143648-Pyramimonas_sp.AAC.1